MRAKQFISELDYPGNIGMMEFVKFQKVATPEQKVRMKLLLATDKKAAWEYLQKVTNTKLQEQVLYEIDMSPSSLKNLAASIGAIAGMEFEMAMPNVEDTEEGEMEPDFDSDDRVSSFDGIEDFFNDGDYNSRREVQRLIERIREDYYEWAQEKRYELWDDERDDFFRDEMRDEFDFETVRETVAEELGLEPDSDEVTERVSELFDEFVEDEWDNQGRLYQNAQENWLEDADMPDETDFFRERGLRYMSDVYNEYTGDINWPYYTYASQGDVSVESIGEDFSDMIGKPVYTSSRYHGAKREPGAYSLEPDSSINADDGGAGLEFITPPMPIDELLSDLQKTIKWAKSKGAYTNNSTGLHMNVSIPNTDFRNLDYTKLALLLGDKYVLEQFGREANTYTKSALDKVKDTARSSPATVEQLLKQMRMGLNKLAANTITESYGKYTSINPKEGYVEFRSPGGDWLEEDISKLTNTLLRFVVALDAALDPEKYRKEYLKKLYQILQPKSNNDPIAYFAQYNAGMLPKTALKSFIRQQQTHRQYEKNKKANIPTGKYWWNVSMGNNFSVEVVATNEEEALLKGALAYGFPIEAANQLMDKFDAKPIKPYEEPAPPPIAAGNTRYEAYMVNDPNTTIGTFYGRANDRDSARQGFTSLLTRLGIDSPAGYGYRISRS